MYNITLGKAGIQIALNQALPSVKCFAIGDPTVREARCCAREYL